MDATLTWSCKHSRNLNRSCKKPSDKYSFTVRSKARGFILNRAQVGLYSSRWCSFPRFIKGWAMRKLSNSIRDSAESLWQSKGCCHLYRLYHFHALNLPQHCQRGHVVISIRSLRSASSANPVRDYKRSWALVNHASSPSWANFASAHTNLLFFVNYIRFIILRVDYNYISKLQLIARLIIDFGRLQSFLKPTLQIVKWFYLLAHPRMLVNCL